MTAVAEPTTRERPIIFGAPMVRAILDGRKTMTRRLVKLEADGCYDAATDTTIVRWPHSADTIVRDIRCPYGKSGDRLWVRESFAQRADVDPAENLAKARHYLHYRATYKGDLSDEWHDYWRGWRSPIHMPRWASRLTLEIAGVRVERLHDITPTDADAEGVLFKTDDQLRKGKAVFDAVRLSHPRLSGFDFATVGSFADLWETIHGFESWNANPWVWVIEFKRLMA